MRNLVASFAVLVLPFAALGPAHAADLDYGYAPFPPPVVVERREYVAPPPPVVEYVAPVRPLYRPYYAGFYPRPFFHRPFVHGPFHPYGYRPYGFRGYGYRY